MPGWRGVGVMAPRSWLCAAKPPAYRTWCTRGGGTKAASFSNRSNGDNLSRDRNTARATLGKGLAVSAFPRYVPV
jgi:hypothetical protein